jgi:glycosyltransferase involved in cell wall biosynthesis
MNNNKKRTLHIVSLKKYYLIEGVPHTYGGFGEFVNMFLDDFDEVHLCVPLSPYPIEGGYPMDHPKLFHHFLPYYKNELFLLLKSPLIFLYLLFYLRKADIINARIPDMTGVYGWLIGKLYRKKIFVSLQSDMTLMLENDESTKLTGIMKVGLFLWLRIYLWFERRIISSTLSFPQGCRLVEKYCKSDNLAIPWISTALHDSDIVLELREKMIKDEQVIKLLNVGRLTTPKQQVDLIEMLHILNQDGENQFHLTIIGKKEPRIYGMLLFLIEKYDLKQYVDIIPPVAHGRELWEVFRNSHIFVFSSIWEGTPKVLLEAMARSIPIVSTNVGGIPSVITDQKNGLLCTPKNPRELAKSVQKLVELPVDDINQIIVNANKKVKEFTVKRQKGVMISAIKSNLFNT